MPLCDVMLSDVFSFSALAHMCILPAHPHTLARPPGVEADDCPTWRAPMSEEAGRLQAEQADQQRSRLQPNAFAAASGGGGGGSSRSASSPPSDDEAVDFGTGENDHRSARHRCSLSSAASAATGLHSPSGASQGHWNAPVGPASSAERQSDGRFQLLQPSQTHKRKASEADEVEVEVCSWGR